VDELLLSAIKCRADGGIRQTEIQTTEPFVPEPNSFSEVEVAIGKLKRYKLPGADQIPAELIQAEGETLYSEIHKLIKLIWNKEELLHQWKESIVEPIHERVIKLSVVIIGHIIAANFIQNFIQHFSL
jgi:cytochrome b